MSFTAVLRFDSAAEGVGTAGTARAIGRANMGTLITALNGGVNGTATTWTFEWLSLPPGTLNGASGTPGLVGVVQTGATTTFVFTADVVGTFVMKLTVSDGASSAVDYLAFAVKTPSGKIVPGFLPEQYDPVHAFNFFDAQGWAELMNPFLRNGDAAAESEVWADGLGWHDANWRALVHPLPQTVTRRSMEVAPNGTQLEVGSTAGRPSLQVPIPDDTAAHCTFTTIMYDGVDTVRVTGQATYTRIGAGAPVLIQTEDQTVKTSGAGWVSDFLPIGNSISVSATAAAGVRIKTILTVIY